jgi:hypothetical protein
VCPRTEQHTKRGHGIALPSLVMSPMAFSLMPSDLRRASRA